MKLKKNKFLNSEFGSKILYILIEIYKYSKERKQLDNMKDLEMVCFLRSEISDLIKQWEIYKLALEHFFGVQYNLTWTDEYMGVCTSDESDWLFKIDVDSIV